LSEEQFKAVKAAWFGEQSLDSEYGRLPRWQGDRARIAANLGWTLKKLDAVLNSARDKMLRLRSERILLPDNKGLAAWNGLVLSALAAAYAASGDVRYQDSARQLAAYLAQTLWDGKRLLRARQGKQVLAEATLEDYALVAQGLWDWSRQDADDKQYPKRVRQLLEMAWQRYFKNGRWVQTDTPLIPMLDGQIALQDSPLPSATAVITRLSLELGTLRVNPEIQEKIRDHLDQARTFLGDSLFWYASYVELLDPDQSLR
jgi:uncharacterized protein YyaL (SSP411 family)